MYACVDIWEAVIWCMGVGVKVDKTRTVIILVPHIYSLFIISCVSYCLFYSAILDPIVFCVIMFMISVLSVCCCALFDFESFIHDHFLSFFFLNFFNFLFNMFLFCCLLLFFWFGLLVALNGIKKYWAWPDKINRNGGLQTNLVVNTPPNHNSQRTSLQQINNGCELSYSKSFTVWNA